MNNRYNIDTDDGDLIQIDLKGGNWKLTKNREMAFLSLIKFSENPENPQRVTIPIYRSDLILLRDKLSEIIG